MTEVTSYITGVIARIEVAVGERVDAGAVLLVLESMKMEMPIEAPVAGTVASIPGKAGDSVLEGDVVATLE